jgi:hypothetical protein
VNRKFLFLRISMCLLAKNAAPEQRLRVALPAKKTQ